MIEISAKLNVQQNWMFSKIESSAKLKVQQNWMFSKMHQMSNFEIQKKLINFAVCQIKTQLTAMRSVILEKQIVPYLVKKFLAFYTTWKLLRDHKCPLLISYPESDVLGSHLTTLFFKSCFNIIFLSSRRYCCRFPAGFPTQAQHTFTSVRHTTFHMSRLIHLPLFYHPSSLW